MAQWRVVELFAEWKPLQGVLDERPKGTRMDTELNCAHAFHEAGYVIGIRVHPWKIRVHPCSYFAPKLSAFMDTEDFEPCPT